MHKKKAIITIISILIIVSILGLGKSKIQGRSKTEPELHQLVSHAAGSIYGYRYTNSLEALEESYKNGFKLIEIDFEWTSDDEVVLIHDWESTVERMFMVPEGVLSLKEFKEFDTFQDLTLMDLEDLVSWLKKKDDAYIITDIKNRNLEALNLIAENYPQIKEQIIPQIYSMEEYSQVDEMGYDNIILTLYKTYYNDDEIIQFAKSNKIFAVTMNIERGYTDLPMKLKNENIATYVHAVNSLYTFEELYENGVTGIYTDYFYANRLSL